MRLPTKRYGIGSYSARARLGLVLILLFATVTGVRWLRTVISAATRTATSDEITLYEARFREMRAVLPPGITVGYVSDPMPRELPRAESRLHARRYILTQYALAPVVVKRSTDVELVVGNFESPASADTAAALRLSLVRDFGEGLMLFRRATD